MATKRHLTLAQRTARGELARDRVPPSSHAGWAPPDDRFDPVTLIEDQNVRRDADLVPLRHARMAASPFTFYRGAAKIMADDLAATPTAGLIVQLCGDAHLSNFGVYGSPERRLVFDINDFDETLPGPFEYDVKRLVASLVVAARNNGFGKSEARVIATDCVRIYREAMVQFASMSTLDVWYAQASAEGLDNALPLLAADLPKGSGKGSKKGAKKGQTRDEAKVAAKIEKTMRKSFEKARRRDSLQALSKLAEMVDGRYRIVSDPPAVVPARDLKAALGASLGDLDAALRTQHQRYRTNLQPHYRSLLDKFEVVDWARKVVGVGSIGTRSFIALLQGRDEDDPLFLQAKEASASVLEGHLPRSRYRTPGERIVTGQRLMQASSDIFLGSTKGYQADRYFYWRQLRDMKGSAVVEQMIPAGMTVYGRLCGWTLARAHARSGDPVAIAAYLGNDDSFDIAITDFAKRYAEQNERDFGAFTEAIATSRIPASE